MRKAIITGITGQDGFFLSNFLLKKGYNVQGEEFFFAVTLKRFNQI